MSNNLTQKNDKIFQQILPLHKAEIGKKYGLTKEQIKQFNVRFQKMYVYFNIHKYHILFGSYS